MDAGVFLISETLGYVAFLVNVPFVVSLIFMLGAVVIVLQQVYGLTPHSWFPWIESRIEGEFHFDLEDIVRFYATASFILFVIWEIFRAIFRLKRASFWRLLMTGVILATLGWGFVIAHVPFMAMAPGTSRVGLAAVFVFFYLLGVGGFALGLVITRGSDALIDRIVGTAEPTHD